MSVVEAAARPRFGARTSRLWAWALVLSGAVWLILLPFRLVGIAVEGVFELLRAIILFPARVLRGRSVAT